MTVRKMLGYSIPHVRSWGVRRSGIPEDCRVVDTELSLLPLIRRVNFYSLFSCPAWSPIVETAL